jgi:hypothetical protein
MSFQLVIVFSGEFLTGVGIFLRLSTGACIFRRASAGFVVCQRVSGQFWCLPTSFDQFSQIIFVLGRFGDVLAGSSLFLAGLGYVSAGPVLRLVLMVFSLVQLVFDRFGGFMAGSCFSTCRQVCTKSLCQ